MACSNNPPTCDHTDCRVQWQRRTNADQFIKYAQFQEWMQISRLHKQPKHNSALSGKMWMKELWEGNDNRFFEQFRMRKPTMANLIQLLKTRHDFKEFEHVLADESLEMLLHVIGHASSFPNVTEIFQHSGQTVSAHFHEVLKAVCSLSTELITVEDPSYTTIPEQLASNNMYFPYFSGCVGAINGTHLSVRIGEDHEITPWINRKGVTSTNVLAAVDFNLSIVYAKVGLEGSMHDSRILLIALCDRRCPFPLPPEGKYYLADSGYPNMKDFLTPYKRTRYHLPDFRQAEVIRNRDENFNYVHSSLRSMVERTFGILKVRFKILRHITKFDLQTQMKILWATFGIHNYLRRYDSEDISLLNVDMQRANLGDNEVHPNEPYAGQSRQDMLYMDTLRNGKRDMLDDRHIQRD